jgi:hypothetical protein
MSGNNIDVDKMTLKRLSDLAFNMSNDEKVDIIEDVQNIIKYSSDIDEMSEKVLLLFQRKLKERNDIFTKGLSNPVAALKPKKPMFYRVE